jgi:transcriptional regulator with XRE-family HTH domain
MATTLEQKLNRLDFKQKLKKLIEEKKLTLYEVAQIVRSVPGTVSRWLNGHSAPPKIARKLILEELEKFEKEK